MAFVRTIQKSSEDSHQSSPAYVLTFIRWSNRDTVNYAQNFELTRGPLVVVNDATDIQVNESKRSVTGSLNVTLRAGDLNYSTAVHPGDYVLVNLVDSPDKAIDIRARAIGGQAINKYNDGFKGVYKIQKIRRRVTTAPGTGAKTYFYTLHAFSFSELNTTIYYNPTATAAFSESKLLFLSQFADWWGEVQKGGKNGSDSNVQKSLILLSKALLGIGLNKRDKQTISATQNAQFNAPPLLGGLLGRRKAGKLTIPDIYNFVFGIWQKSRGVDPGENTSNLGNLFNPNITVAPQDKTYYEVKKGSKSATLKGWKVLGVEDFNQKQIWSVLTSYSNAAINESYTVTRVAPDGSVYPTLIFRQKPFNSEHYDDPFKVNTKKGAKPPLQSHTKFFDLPRWRVSPDIMYDVDLGKDEIGRINYVQLFGRSVAINPKINEGLQATNIYFDQDDIKRHGLRPAVVTSNFDFPLKSGNPEILAKNWAYMLFDILNAGQLRESGSVTCAGIEEPIAVGDNLEFDGSVYHIEGVTHRLAISPDGKKLFRTSLMLTFGTDLDSNSKAPVYPQMEHTDRLTESKRDYQGGKQGGERILPGFSDTQDLPGTSRRLGEEVKETEEVTFTRGADNRKPRRRIGTTGWKNDGSKDKKKDKKN